MTVKDSYVDLGPSCAITSSRSIKLTRVEVCLIFLAVKSVSLSPTMAVCPKCTYFNHPEIKSCEVCDFNLNKQAKKTRLLNDGMTERFMEECSALDDKQIINFNSIASTEGIIELMEELLQAESKKTPAINYRLCSPCHHITQKGFEGAHWSCGYRNIQMLCYALLKGPEYKANLFNGDGDIPDVYGIQTWIEKAWKAGFDVMV